MEIEAVGTPTAPRRGTSLMPEVGPESVFGLLFPQITTTPGAPWADLAVDTPCAAFAPLPPTASPVTPVASAASAEQKPSAEGCGDPPQGAAADLSALVALLDAASPSPALPPAGPAPVVLADPAPAPAAGGATTPLAGIEGVAPRRARARVAQAGSPSIDDPQRSRARPVAPEAGKPQASEVAPAATAEQKPCAEGCGDPPQGAAADLAALAALLDSAPPTPALPLRRQDASSPAGAAGGPAPGVAAGGTPAPTAGGATIALTGIEDFAPQWAHAQVAQAGSPPIDDPRRSEAAPVATEDALAATTVAWGPEGKAASRSEPPGARLGVERLWGYWLRRGNLAAGGTGAAARETVAEGGQAASAPIGRSLESAAADVTDDPSVVVRPLAVPGADSPPAATAAPADFVRGAEGAPAAQASAAAAPGARSGAAGAAPESKTPAHAAAAPPPAQQVLHVARLSLNRPGERVTVQLEPEHLGKVQLVVAREGQGMVATFRVETPEAHQTLVAEVPMLRRELEAQGFTLVRVSVDMEDGSGTWREQRTPRRTGRRAASNYGVGEFPSEASDAGGLRRPWGFDARV